MNTEGLMWKSGKDIKHLEIREEYGHIPEDFSLKDYEKLIMDTVNNKDIENHANELAVHLEKIFVSTQNKKPESQWWWHLDSISDQTLNLGIHLERQSM